MFETILRAFAVPCIGAAVVLSSSACATGKAANTGASSVLQHKDPAGKFSVDYPSRDWTLSDTRSGEIVTTLIHESHDASVVLMYAPLEIALASGWDDTFREGEEARVVKEYPGVKGIRSEIANGPLGREVVVTFSRPGANGQEEEFTIHTMPVADSTDLYRMVGVVRGPRSVALKEATTEIIKSFKVLPPRIPRKPL